MKKWEEANLSPLARAEAIEDWFNEWHENSLGESTFEAIADAIKAAENSVLSADNKEIMKIIEEARRLAPVVTPQMTDSAQSTRLALVLAAAKWLNVISTIQE